MNFLKSAFLAIMIMFLFGMFEVSAESIGDYSDHWLDGDTLYIQCGDVVVSYMCIDQSVLRMSYFPDGNISFPESYAVDNFTWQLNSFNIDNQAEELIIEAGDFTIHAGKYPYRTEITVGGAPILTQPEDGGIYWEGGEYSVKYEVYPDDHYYGTGERSIPFDRRGYFFRTYNMFSGQYELGTSNMNINIPLMVSPKGYGVFFDNTFPGKFDLAYNEYDRWSYTAEGGVWVEYVFAGSMPEVLESYTWLTGYSPMPPKWVMGFIQSKYGYESQEETLAIADTLRMKDIPCDAICLDLYWYEVMGDITWDLVNWPDPEGMMNDLLDEGMRTVLIEQPYVWEASLNYNTAYNSGYFGADSQGVPIIIPNFWGASNAGLLDITDPVVQEWWWDFHPTLIDQGAAGWWTDLHEPEIHPTNMVHYAGSAAEVHNIFAMEWARNIFEHYRAEYPDQRIYNQTRSGFAGIQRYSVMPWSNDANGTFGGLAAQLPIMLGMSMSGIGLNHADIGGFFGVINGELYTRWMQFGCFTPVARAHGWRDKTEPWQYGETIEEISRKYLKWRYRLMPYIYSLAWEYHLTGMPLARPLVLEYPDDQNALNFDAEFLLGENILVAPVVQGGVMEKHTYLPEGTWINLWSEERYSGPGWYYMDAPLEDIPVLIKGGSILPLQTERDYSDQFGQDTLVIRVYSDAAADFTLYEDDGETWGYVNNEYALTELNTEIGAGEVSLNVGSTIGSYSGAPSTRTYIADFRLIYEDPDYVELDGVSLTQAADSSAMMSMGDCWCYKASNNSVLVKFESPSGEDAEITVEKPQTSAGPFDHSVPAQFEFYPPAPNPFNNEVRIEFSLPHNSHTSVIIYNNLGKEVKLLVEEMLGAGRHRYRLNAADMSSGIYYVRFIAGEYMDTQKITLIK